MSLSHEIETALAHDHGARAAELLVEQHNSGQLSDAELHAVGDAVARQYRDFHTHPVHQFYHQLEQGLPGPAYKAVFAPVQADFEATRAWDRRLDEIASERLVNGLIDKIKANDLAGAEQAAVSLITGVPEESRPQRARFIGNILGGLIHEKERAQTLVKGMSRNPMKFGLDPITVTDVEEEYARGAAAAAKRERPLTSAARQNLTDATVELGRQLPGRNVLHEPTDDDIHKFDRAVRAILRSCLLSPQHDKFNEATLLIVEFSPKEVSAAGAMAGVEQRLYGTLGRTARMVAERVFQSLGHHPRVINPYVEFSKANLREKIGHYCVEALGVFKNPDTVPFLKDALQDKEADARTEALFAMGAIGTEAAFDDLLKALQTSVSGRVIEGEQRREAFTIISALGRMVRQMSDANKRSRAIAQVVKILPKEDLEFPVRAVLNFFTGKQDGMDPNVLRWAAQVAVTALWSTDRPELARAGRSQPLGFRQPLIDLLGRLAPFVMGTINDTAMKYVKLYSGAYMAMGEFYTKHPDPSQVPIIRQMLFNTALHDDTKKSEYVKQTVYDSATESQQELTKDQVIASLAYALDKIEGDEAKQAMADMFQQIQSGQLPQPGPETSAILMRAHMDKQRQSGQATMAPGGQPGSTGQISTGTGNTRVEPTQVTEEDMHLIDDLKARYLMAAKRRQKKVAAMNALANRKITPAVATIVAHVDDSDPIIASAAQMALQDFAQPPVAQQSLDTLYDSVLDGIEQGMNPAKVKLGELLEKLGPRRSPLRDKISARLKQGGQDLAARAVLEKLTGDAAGGGPVHKRSTVEMDEEKLGAAASYMPKAGGTGAGGMISDLDKKRAYMQARQEWIRGGKRGPEPKPPE
jgi:HEAT repeat protein